MSDSIYQYVLDQLQRAKGDWSAVALASGVSRRTIEKIARKEIMKYPSVNEFPGEEDERETAE